MNSPTTFRLPRWRLTRWLAHAGDDVPADIRLALIASLYGTLPIFLAGVFNTVAVAALLVARKPEPAFVVWLAVELLLCLIRIVVLFKGRHDAARSKPASTDLHIVLSVLWALSIGYGTFVSLLSGDWVATTLATLSGAAMVGGICFRNFAAPRLVATMILLSMGPYAVGAILSGELVLIIATIQIPLYLLSMTTAAYRLKAMLVSTMRAERENDRRATHDSLTQLPNRSGLERAVERRMRSASAGGASFALFYLDLDGFKAVNDAHGHAAGDKLLKEVARHLTEVTKPGDFIARIGGDEFVIISPVEGLDDAVAFGNSIIASTADTFFDIGGNIATIGVSVGVATYPADGQTLEALLRAADAALYEAKGLGRSRCMVALTGGQKGRSFRPQGWRAAALNAVG